MTETPMSQQQPQEKSRAELWAEANAEDAGEAVVAAEVKADPATKTEEDPAKVAAVEQPTAEAAGAETAADDPYASLPEVVRNELVGLKKIATSLADRLRNAEGHIGGLNSKILAQAKGAATATAATGAEAPTAAELREAKADPKAMAALMADYPEFGVAMKAALDEQAAALRAEIANLKPATQADNLLTVEQFEAHKRHQAVEAKHAGWQATVATPAFMGWLEGQPREFHMLAQSSHPEDAIRLLDAYAATQTSGKTRQQRLNSAAALPTGRASATRTKPIDQMTKAEYWDYLNSTEKEAS